MKVAYYLNEGRKKNLYCRISDGSERVSFSLGYTIDSKDWNASDEGSFEDPYFYALMSFKKHLEKRYHELKRLEVPTSNVLATLKREAETFIDASGMEGIARTMFDDENKEALLPSYDQFIQAFEKHTKLSQGSYKAQTVGNIIHFHTNDGDVFEVDTYEGLTSRLKFLIDGKHYSEIYTETKESIWSEIYIDAGIEKHQFLPVLLSLWERYWHEMYAEIDKKIGRTTHLDAQRAESWRAFQVFMECYDDAGDVIKLAYELDDTELYPMAVVTMMNIFDAGVCYGEYCEEEFFASDEWESISLEDDDADDTGEDDKERADAGNPESPMFFIKISDF